MGGEVHWFVKNVYPCLDKKMLGVIVMILAFKNRHLGKSKMCLGVAYGRLSKPQTKSVGREVQMEKERDCAEIVWSIDLHAKRSNYKKKFLEALLRAFPETCVVEPEKNHHVFTVTGQKNVVWVVQNILQTLIPDALSENRRRHVEVMVTRSDQPGITTEIVYRPIVRNS